MSTNAPHDPVAARLVDKQLDKKVRKYLRHLGVRRRCRRRPRWPGSWPARRTRSGAAPWRRPARRTGVSRSRGSCS